MNSMSSETLLKIAKIYAEHNHADQQYAGHSYMYHLDKVYHMLIRYGVTDSDLLISAYLHDVVEDTTTTVSEVAEIFGQEIATLVDLVSEPKNLTRKEKHNYAYPRIASNSNAVKLKLADRLANMESGGKNDMYIKEYPTFKQALYNDGCDQITKRMWGHLDNIVALNTSKQENQ